MRKILGVAAMVLFLGTSRPADADPDPDTPLHRAAISDPATDPVNPPRSRQVLVPSGTEQMNALFYLAGGSGPRPVLLLLHGLPGNEQNLDLAQAVRRAGWHVLTLHFRGSWGSPGQFSIAGAAQDAAAALDWLRDPRTQIAHGIDPKRIVVGGHSMGGFAGLSAARDQDGLAGIVLLDAWNPGVDAAALTPATRADYIASFDDLGHALAGATPESLTAEVEAHGASWNVARWAPRLAKAPLLAIDATTGIARMSTLVGGVRAAGGNARMLTLASDHSFSDKRIALASAVVTWLEGLAPAH